nr:unnamed protein product [Callosobruchus chinensis]
MKGSQVNNLEFGPLINRICLNVCNGLLSNMQDSGKGSVIKKASQLRNVPYKTLYKIIRNGVKTRKKRSDFERILEEDLNKLTKYFRAWKLQPNPSKSEICKVSGSFFGPNFKLQASWGSSTSTLLISALGLVFSGAEYCAPVWLNSCHTKKVDLELNPAMRIESGTLTSTPTYWLPVPSHIPPPKIRRKNAFLREYNKIMENPTL